MANPLNPITVKVNLSAREMEVVRAKAKACEMTEAQVIRHWMILGQSVEEAGAYPLPDDGPYGCGNPE